MILRGTPQSSLRHLPSTAGRLALAQHPRGAAGRVLASCPVLRPCKGKGSRPERGAGGRQGIPEPEFADFHRISLRPQVRYFCKKQ